MVLYMYMYDRLVSRLAQTSIIEVENAYTEPYIHICLLWMEFSYVSSRISVCSRTRNRDVCNTTSSIVPAEVTRVIPWPHNYCKHLYYGKHVSDEKCCLQ